MRRFTVLAALLWAAAGNIYPEINLTPTPSVRELEGCKFPQLEFRDGERKITYEAPKGWTYVVNDKNTLALIPPDKNLVSAKIKFIGVPAPLILDEIQVQHFKNSAHRLLPPASKIVEEPVITPNPLLLNERPTCEIELTFVLNSQRLRASVLIVDLGESQLRFSLISRPADFDALHKAFRESWYSWQWVGEVEKS